MDCVLFYGFRCMENQPCTKNKEQDFDRLYEMYQHCELKYETEVSHYSAKSVSHVLGNGE